MIGDNLLDRRDSNCKQRGPPNDGPNQTDLETVRPLHAAISLVFSELIRPPAFLESRKQRIAAMVALGSVARQTLDPAFLDLEVSTPGQWCLQSLNSSMRELRIAAGRTLTGFLIDRGNCSLDDLLARNRKNAIAIDRKSTRLNSSHRT